MFSTFAGLGLALAAIGIYSVISYNVTQRVQEIGVRMALGAKRGDILRLILLMVAKFAALGLAMGSLAASSSNVWCASRCSRGRRSGSLRWQRSCCSSPRSRCWPHGCPQREPAILIP